MTFNLRDLIALVIIVCLSGYIAWKKSEEVNVSRGTKKELKAIHQAKDSIATNLKLTQDSLWAAQTVLQAKVEEVARLQKERFKKETDHEKITFKPLANDRVRDSLLQSIYPSFRSVR